MECIVVVNDEYAARIEADLRGAGSARAAMHSLDRSLTASNLIMGTESVSLHITDVLEARV